MKRTAKHPVWSVWIALVLLALACNLPSDATGSPGFSANTAAQTVQAPLTSAAPPSVPGPIGAIPLPTNTVTLPTLKPAPSSVPASPTSNCDAAEFITDVTIPEGEVMTTGEAFTKTWRIKNIGTCSWTSSYAIVFSSGDSMSGPATQALTGNVDTGQTVDISVNLTAPGTAGDYTGYWKLRNASGVLFAQFYVHIEVQNALPPPIAPVVLNNLRGKDGHVRSDRTVDPNPNVGDLDDNSKAQAFVSFDLTLIPSGATITKVVVDFTDFDTLGNPWSLSDGCLYAYEHSYATLDADDYFPVDPYPIYEATRWCGAGELGRAAEAPGMKEVVQYDYKHNGIRTQLVLQFRDPRTNHNGVADMILFGDIKLIVTYKY
jgi:hypothetical protein